MSRSLIHERNQIETLIDSVPLPQYPCHAQALTSAEKEELEKLRKGWAAKKLTRGQMLRCVALEKKAETDAMIAALDKKKEA